MSLRRNFLNVFCLFIIIWITFLLISYLIAVTIFYTLEYPQTTIFMGVLRIVIGLVIAGGWVIAWYRLTRFWLYRILLRKEEA